MKINSFLQNIQKLYQSQIKNNSFQKYTNSTSFSCQINEDNLMRKAINGKRLSSAEKKHLASNPSLQAKIELKKTEKTALEARLKAAKSKDDVNNIINTSIITSIQASKTNPSDANLSIEIAQNLRTKYNSTTIFYNNYDKKV